MSSVKTLAPPLIVGDQLTIEEFLRRWSAIREVERAELIDGIVLMPSPLTLGHSDIQSAVIGWLYYYSAATPGCRSGTEGTWIMRPFSAPQPDASLRILQEYGGQSTSDGTYTIGAPELITEICFSSTSYDLGPKLRLYERSGVREYITNRNRASTAHLEATHRWPLRTA